jgi:hypothetical protein
MSAGLIALVVCVIVLSGAALGAWLRGILPPHHMSDDSRDVIKVGIGLIATISALVLGLLVASAKGSFDTKADEIKQSAARTILLDRNLRQYGPEAQPIHAALKQLVVNRVTSDLRNGENLFSGPQPIGQEDATGENIESIQQAVRMLEPTTPGQRFLQARSLELASDLAQTRWLLLEQRGTSLPVPFLIVLVMWLTVFFGCMGLFAPRNATVYSVIAACALSVSSAIFLVVELDQPFSGLLRISDVPFLSVIQQVTQ